MHNFELVSLRFYPVAGSKPIKNARMKMAALTAMILLHLVYQHRPRLCVIYFHLYQCLKVVGVDLTSMSPRKFTMRS